MTTSLSIKTLLFHFFFYKDSCFLQTFPNGFSEVFRAKPQSHCSYKKKKGTRCFLQLYACWRNHLRAHLRLTWRPGVTWPGISRRHVTWRRRVTLRRDAIRVTYTTWRLGDIALVVVLSFTYVHLSENRKRVELNCDDASSRDATMSRDASWRYAILSRYVDAVKSHEVVLSARCSYSEGERPGFYFLTNSGMDGIGLRWRCVRFYFFFIIIIEVVRKLSIATLVGFTSFTRES